MNRNSDSEIIWKCTCLQKPRYIFINHFTCQPNMILDPFTELSTTLSDLPFIMQILIIYSVVTLMPKVYTGTIIGPEIVTPTKRCACITEFGLSQMQQDSTTRKRDTLYLYFANNPSLMKETNTSPNFSKY